MTIRVVGRTLEPMRSGAHPTMHTRAGRSLAQRVWFYRYACVLMLPGLVYFFIFAGYFSRIEAGALRPELVWVPIVYVVDEVLDRMEPILKDRCVKVDVPARFARTQIAGAVR